MHLLNWIQQQHLQDSNNMNEFPGYQIISEPKLFFNRTNQENEHIHPLQGLLLPTLKLHFSFDS